jgi:hypothetical protein
MALPLFAEIERWITEHGSAAVLKERVALAADQFAALQRRLDLAHHRIVELEKELAELKELVRNATPPLAAGNGVTPGNHEVQFEKAAGALFKREAGGGYEDAVYCPRCRAITSEFAGNWDCSCGWYTDFGGQSLSGIISKLPA